MQTRNKKMFSGENEGQSDVAEYPHSRYTMANIKICKRDYTFLR